VSRLVRRARQWGIGVGGALALAWLTVILAAAVVAPWLPLQRRQDLTNIRAAPSWVHPFGTDSRGIDMIGRVLDGARVSMLVGLASALLGLALGATIGLVAGYRRGRADRSIVVVLDVFAAFPAFVAASLASLVWGQSLVNLVLVLGVLTAPIFARVARAATLPLAERDFVLAARMNGARHRRVMARELVPNIAVPVLSYALLVAGIVISVEGALSFFGAGVPDRYTTWGKLIAAGQERVDRSPHLSLIPSGMIVLTVLSLNTVAERWQRHWLFGGAPPKPPRPRATRHTRAEPLADDLLERGPRGGLQIEDLHTHLLTPFGTVHAVDGVDLVLEPGRLTALVGESGSGKSMLARTVLGLVGSATDERVPGRVRYGGVDLLRLDEPAMQRLRGRRIAMVFQDPMTSLDPVLRIGRQLTEPMRLHLGVGRREARARALELLRAVGIPDPGRRLRSYPHELSGGLRQRAAIAIALSCDPDVLIADEPTSALDVTVQAQLLDLLDELRAARRVAMLLITHDLGIVAGRADEIAVMYAGRIVECGPTATVFRDPQHPYTVALLGAIPRLDRASHHRLAAIPGAPPILLGRPPGCAFAPRCQHAGERCTTDDPTLSVPDAVADGTSGAPGVPGRQVACWYPVGAIAAPR
jgi:peptide/nickel transport system permease protein